MALARGLGQADPVQNVLLEIIGDLRHQGGQRAHGHAGVQGDVAAAAAHNLHHAAPVVGLGGVADPVDHLHSRVQGRVISNGVIRAGNVVVNGAGHADAGNARTGQVPGSAEGAVAANHHHAVNALFAAHVGGLLHAFGGVELGAAGGEQGRAAMLHDVGHAAHVHFLQIPIEQAIVAAHHAIDLHAKAQARTHHCAHRGVHAGGIAAAGQYCNRFRTHCRFLQVFEIGLIAHTSDVIVIIIPKAGNLSSGSAKILHRKAAFLTAWGRNRPHSPRPAALSGPAAADG